VNFYADDALWQLIKPELDELSALGGKAKLYLAVMWITNCIVHASAAAMHEPPLEAVVTIAALVSKPREDLRGAIADGRQETA
jgi:hypothetical protein